MEEEAPVLIPRSGDLRGIFLQSATPASPTARPARRAAPGVAASNAASDCMAARGGWTLLHQKVGLVSWPLQAPPRRTPVLDSLSWLR